jgi:hypothetical protein
MNNIIPASRLGELLAAKTGADVDTCTKFVKEYFGLIEATLSTGEDVTIKGIGTFKLTGNDVEPVVYDVDKTLAATVNSPFDAFSAIELEDNELTEPTAEAEPQPEAETEAETETTEEVTTEVTTEADATTESKEAPTEDVAEEQAEDTPQPITKDRDDEAEYYEHLSQQQAQIFPKGWAAFWMILAFVLGLLLGTALGYFGYKEINKYLANMPETVEVIYDENAE